MKKRLHHGSAVAARLLAWFIKCHSGKENYSDMYACPLRKTTDVCRTA